jgi:hypothetical protein
MVSQKHLVDLTNGFRLPPPVLDAKQNSSLHQNASRQIPPRQLHHLDSSETVPSEHESIYDAERVPSEKEENSVSSDSDDGANLYIPTPVQPPSPSVQNPRLPKLQHVSPAEASLQAINDQWAPRNKWTATRLDTIAERMSQRTLRNSVSLSRAVSASTAAPDDIGTTEAAAGDMKSTLDNDKTPQRLYLCHHRSFSLNDLDCLKLPKPNFYLHNSSSSSGDAFRAACPCEKYPIQPKEPPPVRVPTPPGLPTFGTREALEFRMPPPERRAWVAPWRTSRVVSDAAGPSGNQPGAANANEATENNPSVLSDGLKRILGISRVVSPIPEEPARMSLPPYLARADDGTVVRGRFGARHSAHGIGRGQLDSHPFHRDPGDSSGPGCISLDRAIEEIDKACAEVERSRMASASPRAHGSAPRSRSASPTLPAQRTLSIAEILQQSNIQPSNSPSSAWCSPRPFQPMRSQPSISFDRLESRSSVRSQSTLGFDGVRQFVEQGERISVEQNRELTKKKKERSKCANCWIGFCVCCCDMDDPDLEVLDASRVMLPERVVSAMRSPETRPLRIVHEQPIRPQRMVYRS